MGQGLISTQTFHSPHVLYHYVCLHPPFGFNPIPYRTVFHVRFAPILTFGGLTRSDTLRHFFNILLDWSQRPSFPNSPNFRPGILCPTMSTYSHKISSRLLVTIVHRQFSALRHTPTFCPTYLRTGLSNPIFNVSQIFDQGSYAPPFPHSHAKIQVNSSSASPPTIFVA